MRRSLIATACVICAGLGGCGDDPPAPTPTPAVSYEPGAAPAYQKGNGILGPAGDARNTVDRLNDLQEQTSDQTGGP